MAKFTLEDTVHIKALFRMGTVTMLRTTPKGTEYLVRYTWLPIPLGELVLPLYDWFEEEELL